MMILDVFVWGTVAFAFIIATLVILSSFQKCLADRRHYEELWHITLGRLDLKEDKIIRMEREMETLRKRIREKESLVP